MDTLELLDPGAARLFEPGAEPEAIAEGFVFVEGPVWSFTERHLTFSDIPGNTMYRWEPESGARVHRRPSEFANGLAYGPDGALLVCEHRGRRIARETADGYETVVDSYDGKRLNAPNDLVPAPDGSLVFTDPHYGLLEGLGGPAEQEQPVRGVYRLPPGQDEPQLLVSDFTAPNGLALAPDGRTLYVDDSEESHIRSFRVGPDWEIEGGDVLAEIPSEGDAVPDGMKLDVEGNLYCTGGGGIWVLSSAGAVLARIRFEEVAANLAWGEEDARTMFVTASSRVYRLRCRVEGYAAHR